MIREEFKTEPTSENYDFQGKFSTPPLDKILYTPLNSRDINTVSTVFYISGDINPVSTVFCISAKIKTLSVFSEI